MPKPANLGLNLGRGEVEAIALGLELKAAAVLMDDHKARLAAERKGLVVLGTLTLMENAAEQGLLDLNVAVATLRQTTFHIKPHLLDEALARHQQRLRERHPGLTP
jgi:predicted nucleic acid-binding protein